jgi:hypothetical protein
MHGERVVDHTERGICGPGIAPLRVRAAEREVSGVADAVRYSFAVRD